MEMSNDTIFENQEREYSSDTTSIPGEIFTPPNVTIGKKIIKRKKNQMAEEAYEVMKSMVKSQENRDEYNVFGEIVACKIRKLPTDYSKSTVQHLINSILYDAELGRYNNPPQQHNFNLPYSQTFNYNQPQNAPFENIYANSACTSTASSSYNAPTPTLSEESSMDEILQC